MLEEDPKISEEFKKVFNITDITEKDYFTPEVLEDTCVDMEIALQRYGEVPEFAKVTKFLQGANGIPISRARDNPMLDTRCY